MSVEYMKPAYDFLGYKIIKVETRNRFWKHIESARLFDPATSPYKMAVSLATKNII